MDEETLHITNAEEKALKAMEGNASSSDIAKAITDKECMQVCEEISELAISMRAAKELPPLNIDKELSAFHQKHPTEKRRMHVVWKVALLGAAAAITLFIVLHKPTIPTITNDSAKGVLVFQADHSAQQVTLQETDEANTQQTVQLSANEINYTKERIDQAIAEKRLSVHKLHIPRGETFKVVLSDGTEVLLNADSRLTYPVAFKGKERVVSLEGEGYFKVAKDSEHPFIVRSGALRTQVLGTEFNIRNYDPKNTSVTLIQGKVEVSDTCGLQSVRIAPGQNACLSSDGTFTVSEVDLDPYIYWKEGYFYFDNITWADMMKEIGRWYNVDVEFRDKAAMNLRMHFFANRKQSIQQTIELLNRMEKVATSLENGKLIIG